MAREKGTGNLQREKSGRWTMRVCIDGKRLSRSTRTKDRTAAEVFLNRFLAPFGLGERTLPLATVWREYEKSLNRRELSPSTMKAKRLVWMHFAAWIEENHIEITQLKQLTSFVVAEYLRVLKLGHCASTYNNRVCVLREICHVLAEQAGMIDDPWTGVRLLADDSHTRREFNTEELSRILAAASRRGEIWRLLFAVGIYTGLRLGDCCTLEWRAVNFERNIIQLIPKKTRKHANGHPVTIPIHPDLAGMMRTIPRLEVANDQCTEQSVYVLPQMAKWYLGTEHWRISDGLCKIFKDAGIRTSVMLEGRRMATPDATFHSLRHTFVSFSANAGVPLAVVQAIVGHSSSAMTRHYYHENEEALRKAVAAIPGLGHLTSAQPLVRALPAEETPQPTQARPPLLRIRELERLKGKGLITEEEYLHTRARILAEI